MPMPKPPRLAAQPTAATVTPAAQPTCAPWWCGFKCRNKNDSELVGVPLTQCTAAVCSACFERGPAPSRLYNELPRTARPQYSWAAADEGGPDGPTGIYSLRRGSRITRRCDEDGVRCSEYAVCMSGALRSFDLVKTNLEVALLLPNGPADLFAHVYYEPERPDHRRGLQWLRNAPYSRAVAAEVYDETVEEDIVAAFPDYERLREEDVFGVLQQGKETTAWLSMIRKIFLANELRRRALRPAPHGPSHFGRAPRRVVAGAPTHHTHAQRQPRAAPISHSDPRSSQPQGARGGAREAVPRRRAHAARPDVRRRGAARSTRLRAPRAAAGAAAADPALWRRYLLQRWPRRQSQRRRRRRWRQAWRWRRTRRWWWWWQRRRRVGPRGAAADSDPTRQRLAVGHVRAAADVPRGARRRRGALQHRRYGAAAMAPARWLRRDGVEDGHAHRPLRAVAARRAGAPRSTVAIPSPVAIRSFVAILQP